LIESNLFIIQEGPPPETSSKRVAGEGMTIQLRNIDWNGKQCLPAFSSLTRLQAVIPYEVAYLALNTLEFMKIIQGSEFFLNPGSEYGKEFTREEIGSLIDGSIWKTSEMHVMEKDLKVVIGEPANYPTELANALTRYFRNTKSVKRAYLAHFFNPEYDEKPHTLIAVDFVGEWDSLMAGAGMVARDVHVPDPPVDFLPMSGSVGIEDYFRNECKPFYQRKRFGIF